MANLTGANWKTDKDGNILFRPHLNAATLKISAKDHQRIERLKTQEILASLITILPLAGMLVLWHTGNISWRWLGLGAIVYGSFNTIFYLRSRKAIRALERTSPRAAEQLPPAETGLIIGNALREAGASTLAFIRWEMRFIGWMLGAFGFVFVLLAAVMNGSPALWIGAILLPYLLWEFVLRRPRGKTRINRNERHFK